MSTDKSKNNNRKYTKKHKKYNINKINKLRPKEENTQKQN